MRLLHTSDWHLGRTLHGVDLLDAQEVFLDHLVALAAERAVDAVVVAGDVYDRAIPPVRAVALLSRTLARLAEVTHVVLTPGNHDSATRLGFGAELMRPEVHVRARVEDVGVPVVVPAQDGSGEVWLYALPYLDPDATRRALSPDPTDPALDLPRSHAAVVGAAMDRVRADVAGRMAGRPPDAAAAHVVVAAHAFVVGGEASESERDIRVGGVDSVPAGAFAGVDYVALGHLHGAQQVAVLPPAGPAGSDSPGSSDGPAAHGTVLRYAGSPLAFSFSEVRQRKSSAIVTLEAGRPAEVELVPAPVPRRLADLSGTLAELCSAAFDAHVDDWVRVTVTDPIRPTDLFARLEQRFPHVLVRRHQPVGASAGPAHVQEVTAASDPVVVLEDFVRHVTGREASDAERLVLRTAVEDVAAAERSA